MNFLHIKGMFLRDFFATRRSWERMVNLFFWVTVEILVWGFFTLWIKDDLSGPAPRVNFVLLLIGALVYWDVFLRAQQSFSIAFLEDVWSRNVINVFTAPLRASEFIIGLLSVAVFKIAIAFIFMVVLAWALYSFQVFTLGFYIIPLLIHLFLFGFVVGLVTVGLIMRFGPSIEVIAWAMPFVFQPFSAVFYPITILPEFLQKIAFFIPTMHLFEGMREVLLQGTFPVERIIWASALNVAYIVLALLFFAWILRVVRRRGALGRFVTN